MTNDELELARLALQDEIDALQREVTEVHALPVDERERALAKLRARSRVLRQRNEELFPHGPIN